MRIQTICFPIFSLLNIPLSHETTSSVKGENDRIANKCFLSSCLLLLLLYRDVMKFIFIYIALLCSPYIKNSHVMVLTQQMGLNRVHTKLIFCRPIDVRCNCVEICRIVFSSKKFIENSFGFFFCNKMCVTFLTE